MWGAGDQGRVNWKILNGLRCELVALIDDTPNLTAPIPDVPLLRGWSELEAWLGTEERESLGFVLAIGNPYGHVRCELHDRLAGQRLVPISFSDPSALLCQSARYESGLQVMPLALVHNDAIVGRQCILNTRSTVEHDCVLGEGVEVGPGAILCGRVQVGSHTWIGAGTTVRPQVKITPSSTARKSE
jgi:sugar O-acyltransferase (sialic acid O-acetyltransferase NeuD family)